MGLLDPVNGVLSGQSNLCTHTSTHWHTHTHRTDTHRIEDLYWAVSVSDLERVPGFCWVMSVCYLSSYVDVQNQIKGDYGGSNVAPGLLSCPHSQPGPFITDSWVWSCDYPVDITWWQVRLDSDIHQTKQAGNIWETKQMRSTHQIK